MRTPRITYAVVLGFSLVTGGCGGAFKEAWLGVDPDLHGQLTSLQSKESDRPGKFFGKIPRADLEATHSEAEEQDFGFVSLEKGQMCIRAEDSFQIIESPFDDDKMVKRYSVYGWVGGAHKSLEADFPAGTPWPKAPAPGVVTVKSIDVHIKKNPPTPKNPNGRAPDQIYTTEICVPAPVVTPETQFLSMVRLSSEKDTINTITIWQIEN